MAEARNPADPDPMSAEEHAYEDKWRVIFDTWRATYNDSTLEDQQRFHSMIWNEFPDQSHYSPGPLVLALAGVEPKRVVELGGWDGQAAVDMLNIFPTIEEWVNVEICKEAVQHGLQHPKYKPVVPSRWYWEDQWSADLFVGMHVIEHLRAEQLAAIFDATDAPAIYLEAPLYDTTTDWLHTPTTHILEIGWAGVDALLAERGYARSQVTNMVLPPRSGDFSRACLYQKESDG